ncbi:hypothetical protein PV11_07514 [Exophiala sideris]|uniref:Uncharacterized protein n=1 Tax=Exophiala sideris TaxID=1016849 RepID=A0A0D1WXU7_9EURO|nr:hypothetical protein PV11_07514 [Exophiala sideris]
MSKVPDAWEDEWSTNADDNPTAPAESAEPKKVTSKVSKAQRRAQQAEFNRQLWAEAEGPKETNYFLESRNIVPLRTEFKPPPILLSRKGPKLQSSRPPTAGLSDLTINDRTNAESSEDEDEAKERELSLAERQAQAAKEREEKQRKYEERRQELFGPSSAQQQANNKSGTSTPSSLTPPGSRSATPNRGRGKGGRRGGANSNTRNQSRGQQHPELFDPLYAPKQDSGYVQRHESGVSGARTPEIRPIRAPKGPDGTGRGGFGFTIPRISRDEASTADTTSIPSATE